MKTLLQGDAPFAFPRKVNKSFWMGAHFMREGAMLNLPIIGFEVGTAQRGERVPTLAGKLVGMAAIQPAVAGVTAGLLTTTLGLPPVAAAFGALFVGGMVAEKAEDKLVKGLRFLSSYGERANRLQFGGGYQDTFSSAARRQRAINDMTRAMPLKRSWLGQEALALHR